MRKMQTVTFWPVGHLTLGQFFCEVTSKVIHTPSVFNPSSRVRRMITVSDTVMLAAVIEHHTASPQSIWSPDDFNSSFHAVDTMWSSPVDVAMIQQLPAKSRRPRYPFPTSSTIICVDTCHKTSLLVCPELPQKRSAAQGSPCDTDLVRRIPGVAISSSLTSGSELLYSLIQLAISTSGTPITNVALMISRCET